MRRPLLAVIVAGLLLRLVLAFVLFPGRGFGGDLRSFGTWAQELATSGPGAFYARDPSANYPPAYLYVLWTLGGLGGPALAALLKLPAILADVGVALLVARAAGRWLGGRAGVAAAALYLFIPVTWYDSALWGQVDAVATLVMMAALVLLIEGWSETASVAAALGVLTKPQALVCLAVVVPVLVRRHLLAAGTGPVPALGPHLARLDEWAGGLLTAQGPVRLLTSAAAAGIASIAVLAPFDIEQLAPAPWPGVPVLGKVAGLLGLLQSVGSQYSVLTANAYNAWALVGPHPLALGIGTGAPAWTSDLLPLAGGVPAVDIGAGLLGIAGLLVAGGLLLRDGRLPVVLGFTVLAFAFYALPTRVHERYLFPVFASGAILASGAVVRAAGYAAVGLLNAVNLHAVLAAPLAFGVGAGPGRRGPFGPAPAGSLTFAAVHLPLADVARSPLAVTAVSLGQAAAMIALLGAWLVVLASGPEAATGPGAPPARPGRPSARTAAGRAGD